MMVTVNGAVCRWLLFFEGVLKLICFDLFRKIKILTKVRF